MAIVSVTADNLRADDMNAVTNTASIGGGAGEGVEPDFVYQGTASVSRKIGTSQAGFYSDTGAARDMTAARRTTWMAKFIATNSSALEAVSVPGIELRIGSGTGAYYSYNVQGNDTYPIKGGWVILPIDPNVTSYRDATTGSPNLAAAQYFGILGDFTATSKSENLAMDAIDIGAGLNLVGGDSTDPDGVWQDFVNDDEGDTAATTGRYGYIYTTASDPSTGDSIIMECYGMFWIGQTNAQVTTATVFNDSGRTLLFPDGLFDAGFSGISVDLGNATTDVDFSDSTFRGLGTKTGVDTRPVFTATGTSGAFDATNCVFDTFADLTLTSTCTLTNCTIANSEGITQSGATITGCTISGATTADGVAFITSNNPGLISDCSFTFSDGHAIEITTAGTYTFDGNLFSGYGANGTNDAAIYNNSGGAVTLNIINGGDTPTVRNGTSATTTVNNTVTVSVTVQDANDLSNIENARVLLLAGSGGSLPAGDSITITSSGTTATVTHTAHGLSTGAEVLVSGANEDEYNGVFTITVTGANTYTYTLPSTSTSPATGTITSTFVILNGLTNSSGLLSDSGFDYTGDQPVTGRVRKADSSPYYKTGPITGTITSGGFGSTILLILDE